MNLARADEGLAPYASREADSRGRVHAEPGAGYRGEYERDRDRIVHCGAFRRLVYKTQVFVNHEGDLYRTRLTHSLEVAQIGRSVSRRLRLNEPLAEAICLAHDLGHTPFGHAGQDALNACMRDYGGFEHNLQSLRVVDELEQSYAEFKGLNLTHECREGILKHCSVRNAEKLGELGRRFIERRQPGIEAQLANVADEIAYNNHDVDDGLRAGLITIEELLAVPLFARQHAEVIGRYPALAGRRLVHEIVRRMINALVTDLVDATQLRLAEAHPASAAEVRSLGKPLVGFSAGMEAEHLELKRFLLAHLYRHFRVLRMTRKATRIVRELFAAYFEDVRLLPDEHRQAAESWTESSGDSGKARAVADYVAGMTDRYAILEHGRLYDPRASGG
jgi:dGTPase